VTGRRVADRRVSGRALARTGLRVLAALLAAGALVAAAPVTLIAAASACVAWHRGWPPGRLSRAAAWLLPAVAVWLGATALATRAWPRVAAAPYLAWDSMWHLVAAGSYARAIVIIAPVAIPLGLVAGDVAWSHRIRSMEAAAGGTSPGSAVSFDRRQWRHQVRSAAARIAAPGAVPLTTAAGEVVVGGVIRAVGHRATGLARLRYERLRSHQVIIGGTGTGKTTLLLRLWAAFMATAMRRYAAGQGLAPLLVVLDCKGGGDARKIADRARRVLRAAGARTTAIWPDEASLSIWVLPPHQLITTLVDLIEHGTGGASYYADILDAVVALAVNAPGGPPDGREDFLARLDPGWLTAAYLSSGSGTELELIRSASRQISDVALRYRTLFRRLGAGLDGPGRLDDADAWYCILEGTAEVTVAEAQARALIDLLASYITSGQASREVLLAVDEFSAVSRRLPIWALYERARSLGLAVQVSAQSWHGLAPGDAERYRIVSAAEGGIWLLRTPHPEPVTELAGQRRALDTSRQLVRFPRWSKAGSSRLREVPVADPDLVRALDVGQAAYLYRGGVTFVQVSRLIGAPAPLQAAPQEAVRQKPTRLEAVPPLATADRPDPRVPSGPVRSADLTALLDAAFGPEPGSGPPPRRTAAPPAADQAAEQAAEPDEPAAQTGETAVRAGERPEAAGDAAASDPFGALGLPASSQLTDDDVRAAWRRVAAATHPDRADGGDPAAFAAAAAAYSDLRTRFGRGETLADRDATAARAAAPARRWAARVSRGRPVRLTLRILAAAAICAVVVAVNGWRPASPALILGAVIWLVAAGRPDIGASRARGPSPPAGPDRRPSRTRSPRRAQPRSRPEPGPALRARR
jgi:hypothetical protein